MGGRSWPYSLDDIETGHSALIVPLGDHQGHEYLLLENKVVVANTWTEYLPGGGLLITHCDNGLISAKMASNSVNSGLRHGVTIVEADDDADLWTPGGDRGSNTDPFYQPNRSSLRNPPLNDGGMSFTSITDIGPKGSNIVFLIESFHENSPTVKLPPP
jgi:hypothetical protein